MKDSEKFWILNPLCVTERKSLPRWPNGHQSPLYIRKRREVVGSNPSAWLNRSCTSMKGCVPRLSRAVTCTVYYIWCAESAFESLRGSKERFLAMMCQLRFSTYTMIAARVTQRHDVSSQKCNASSLSANGVNRLQVLAKMEWSPGRRENRRCAARLWPGFARLVHFISLDIHNMFLVGLLW